MVCPPLSVLESLALGTLASDDSSAIEDHLAECRTCLDAMIELNPADSLIEALREAPATAGRRSVVQQEIVTLQAKMRTAILHSAFRGVEPVSQNRLPNSDKTENRLPLADAPPPAIDDTGPPDVSSSSLETPFPASGALA